MHPPDRYTGHRLSDLLAIGRETVELVCRPCGGSPKTYRIHDLIERYGNVVLPAVISLTTPGCPRRGKAMALACSTVFVRPLTVEEEIRIKAWRMP